jgi:hypothetical protein
VAGYHTDLSHERSSIRSIGAAVMRRVQESPVSPTQGEAILILDLTSSKLYPPMNLAQLWSG